MKTARMKIILAALPFYGLALATLPAQSTARVSVSSSGVQSIDDCEGQAVSGDGRFVAFSSRDIKLVRPDTNGSFDVFVHDRQTGLTTRVSVNSAGGQGNGDNLQPSLSADGRFVAFTSLANDLVIGDTNLVSDVFVHDRLTGSTSRVSVSSTGAEAGGASSEPSISGDGRFVAFSSSAQNLVARDTNGFLDIFVHDRMTGQTIRASVSSAGMQANGSSSDPSLAADGRSVAFESVADNLVLGQGAAQNAIFVHEQRTSITTIDSVSSAGMPANRRSLDPALSADGRFVAFSSSADNLVAGDTNSWYDAFVRDRQTGQTTRVSISSAGVEANEASFNCAISWDGRIVAFSGHPSNLVPGDNNSRGDVFIHDRETAETTRVSVSTPGVQANGHSRRPSVSANGRVVVFDSYATDLVTGDTNNAIDVFARDRGVIGPSMTQTGTCPGLVTLTLDGVTAHGLVAVVHGAAGVFVKRGPPCQGLFLGVGSPTLTGYRTADGAGSVVLSFNAPPGACGLSVQASDVSTCQSSNVIVL